MEKGEFNEIAGEVYDKWLCLSNLSESLKETVSGSSLDIEIKCL